MTRIALLLLAAALLCACATTRGTVGVDANGDVRTVEGVDPNYAVYVDSQRAVLAQQQATLTAFATLAAACTDARCVENVSSNAAIAAMAGAGKGGEVRPYVAQPSGWERFGLALVGQLSPIASAAVAWHASDNQARTTEAMYDFLGGAVDAAAGAAPRIEVGGDYTGGDRSETNTSTSTDVGRDQTGGDHQDGSVVGDDNRIESPDYDCVAGTGAPGGAGGVGGTASGATGAPGAAGGTGGNCGG